MTAPEVLRDGNAHALIVFKQGRRWLRALALHAPPVRVVKLEHTERCHLQPLLYRGQPYPLRRALRHFKQAGRTLGITDSARAVLRALQA